MNINEHLNCILKINPEAKVVVRKNNNGTHTVIYDPSHTGQKPTLTDCESVLPDVIEEKTREEEKKEIIKSLESALIWQYRMIEAIFELGKSKGLWNASDITDTELKQKYAEWRTKLSRLREI